MNTNKVIAQAVNLPHSEKVNLLMSIHPSTPDLLRTAIADLEVGIARESKASYSSRNKKLITFWTKNLKALQAVLSTYHPS